MSANLLISVVDDDDAAREAIASLVRALGFTVTEFQNPAEFLKSRDLLRTACLIADMRMPGMTGLELHRHLIAAGTPIPTVLVTAYPDEMTGARAAKAGVRCYLGKPLEPDALLDCIHSTLANPTGGPE